MFVQFINICFCLCYIYLLKTIYIYTTAQVTIPLISWKKGKNLRWTRRDTCIMCFCSYLRFYVQAKYLYIFIHVQMSVCVCARSTEQTFDSRVNINLLYISQFTDTHIYGKFDLWKDSGRNVSYSLGLTKIYLPLLCFFGTLLLLLLPLPPPSIHTFSHPHKIWCW